MASIVDDRGYNQMFRPSESTNVRLRRRADFILAEMDSKTGANVLEIGCGSGEMSYYIAAVGRHSVLSVDICAPFVARAQERYRHDNLSFRVLDFNDPSVLSDRSFDYIVGNGILHHLYFNLDASLSSIHRCLKPGGKMIFMEPNIYNPYCAIIFNFTRKLAKLEPDEMAFSRRFIRSKLRQAGFDEVSVSYRDFLVPGVPSWMIKPSVVVGDYLELIPPINRLSQSLFIVGRREKRS